MFKRFNSMNSVSFPLLDGWRLATFTFSQVCCFIKEHVYFNAFIKKLCKKNCEKMLNNKFDFFVFIIYIYEIYFSCRKKLVFLKLSSVIRRLLAVSFSLFEASLFRTF